VRRLEAARVARFGVARFGVARFGAARWVARRAVVILRFGVTRFAVGRFAGARLCAGRFALARLGAGFLAAGLAFFAAAVRAGRFAGDFFLAGAARVAAGRLDDRDGLARAGRAAGSGRTMAPEAREGAAAGSGFSAGAGREPRERPMASRSARRAAITSSSGANSRRTAIE
jgi:hypothetical protein